MEGETMKHYEFILKEAAAKLYQTKARQNQTSTLIELSSLQCELLFELLERVTEHSQPCKKLSDSDSMSPDGYKEPTVMADSNQCDREDSPHIAPDTVKDPNIRCDRMETKEPTVTITRGQLIDAWHEAFDDKEPTAGCYQGDHAYLIKALGFPEGE